MDNVWAKEAGLPDSQPFTWDHKTKNTYITTGHHLHCLVRIISFPAPPLLTLLQRNIYISLDEFHHDIPQTLE